MCKDSNRCHYSGRCVTIFFLCIGVLLFLAWLGITCTLVVLPTFQYALQTACDNTHGSTRIQLCQIIGIGGVFLKKGEQGTREKEEGK